MLNDADASGFKKVYLAMGFTDHLEDPVEQSIRDIVRYRNG